MEHYHHYYGYQIAVDRGLQSSSLSDVLSVLCTYGAYVEECPFPSFANFILIRLAETFEGEKFSLKLTEFLNDVRLRIVKSIRENGNSLKLAFSGGRLFEAAQVVMRCALKVSHSNDYRARSLTLLFLGSLAPLIAENKKAHHLLIESLDTSTEPTELFSAIDAANQFGRNSFSFSLLMTEKLPELLSTIHDESVLLRLIDVVANMKESAMVATSCLEILSPMLKENYSNRVRAAFYACITNLAMKSRLAIPEVIGALLAELDKSGTALFVAMMQNITILASFPHQWDGSQLARVMALGVGLRSSSNTRAATLWLDCIESLAAFGAHHLNLLGEHSGWIKMLDHDNFSVRTAALSLAVKVLRHSPTAETAPQLQNIVIASIAASIREAPDIDEGSKFRFFKVIADYVSLCTDQAAEKIARDLMASGNRRDQNQRLHTLCVLSQAHSTSLAGLLFKWASTLITSTSTSHDVTPGIDAEIPSALYNLMLASASELTVDEDALSGVVSAASKSSCWSRYKVARAAFQYGRWRGVALPLMKTLQNKCESLEARTWIDALVSVAESEIASSSTLTLNDIDTSVERLRTASLLLKPLALASGKGRQFTFASSFLSCLASTREGIRGVMALLNVKLFTLRACQNQASVENAKIGNLQLSLMQKSVVKAREEWSNLYLRSFDADEGTLNTIHVGLQLTTLLENLIYLVCARQKKLPPISNFTSGRASVIDRSLLSTLSKIREKIEIDASDSSVADGSALTHFIGLLESFKSALIAASNHRIGLPRFFFQQLYSTSTKLNITPQPKDGSAFIGIPGTNVSLQVEGVIQTNNPRRIESLSVEVEVNFMREEDKSYTRRQSVYFESDEKYFKCQFMLRVPEIAHLKLNIWYTDAESKRSWLDGGDKACTKFDIHPREQ